jgi:hypothetical protein
MSTESSNHLAGGQLEPRRTQGLDDEGRHFASPFKARYHGASNGWAA